MKIKDYYKNRKIHNHYVSIITDYDKDIIEDGIFVSCKEGKYIDSAIKKGAKTIIYDKNIKIKKQELINYIGVESPKKELTKLLQFEYSINDRKSIFIGITGTNGKTTTSYLLYKYLKWLGNDVLYIGTGWIYSVTSLQENIEYTNNTTPSISYLYKYLRNNKYDYVILEVSSQGIEEGRILGVEFDIISITNLGHDHLDYHSTINEYRIVKGKLLSQLNTKSQYKKIVLNKDDINYKYFSEITLHDVVSYGINQGDNHLINYNSSLNGIDIILKDKKIIKIKTNLIGDFNIYNLLNLYTINKVLKLNVSYLKSFLSTNLSVPGRMNVINKDKCTFIVDYAHTPDSIKAVLKFIQKIKSYKKLIVIVGAGGNRDISKRSIIGNLVCKYGDYVYFTEDNSRNENPEHIINDIISGVKSNNYEIILSRKNAILEAYKKHNDSYILVLGKGIEKSIIKKNIIEEHNDLTFIEGLS